MKIVNNRYIIEVKRTNKSKVKPGSSIGTLATAAAVGVGLFGMVMGGARLAGVGRFASQEVPRSAQTISNRPAIVQQPQVKPVVAQQKPAAAPVVQAKQEPKAEVKKPTYHPGTFDFIKSQEGFRDTAYADRKQWSVGYGTKSSKGEKISKDEAAKRLETHVNTVIMPKVENLKAWNSMNDRQRGAFTSFLYNVGEGVIGSKEHPNFNAALQSGDINKVFNQMQSYNKVTDPKTGKKVVDKGLVNRRAAERNFAFQEQ